MLDEMLYHLFLKKRNNVMNLNTDVIKVTTLYYLTSESLQVVQQVKRSWILFYHLLNRHNVHTTRVPLFWPYPPDHDTGLFCTVGSKDSLHSTEDPGEYDELA